MEVLAIIVFVVASAPIIMIFCLLKKQLLDLYETVEHLEKRIYFLERQLDKLKGE